MRLSLFNHLANTLEILPARAILKTLELESQMLKDDMLNDRPIPVGEAQSVLDFYEFLRLIKSGSEAKRMISTSPFHPMDFYRKTIERLVAAKELPAVAIAQFEEAFRDQFLEPKQAENI